MHRYILYIAAFVFFTTPAYAVTLKHSAVLNGPTITLGDLFDGIEQEQKASKVLGAAPQPGQETVLNARTLLRIALATDLSWRPVSNTDRITVSRAATIIGKDLIEDAILEEFHDEGFEGTYEFIIPDDQTRIILPPNLPQTLEVREININPDSGQFKAAIVSPSRENPLHRLTVTGMYEKLLDIPVLSSTVTNGQIIRPDHLQTISVRERSLKHGTILSSEDLLGMTPRQMIRSGQPVKVSDIESPKVIERGDFVTIAFQQGPLSLTAQGKAMEHGAKGDMIRVLNISSNKTLEAVVDSPRHVRIQTF